MSRSIQNCFRYLECSFIITDVQVLQVMQRISLNWCELVD